MARSTPAPKERLARALFHKKRGEQRASVDAELDKAIGAAHVAAERVNGPVPADLPQLEYQGARLRTTGEKAGS